METYLTLSEVSLIEESAGTLRDRLLIRLLFRLGCRISEALALTTGDIDFEKSTVTILHLKTSINLICPYCHDRLARKHNYCPGCGKLIPEPELKQKEKKRTRSLPVDSETIKLIQEFIELGGPVNKEGRIYLFGINRHRAWQIIRSCAKRAGLDSLINPETGKPRGISPHRLRDAFAVHAMKTDDSGNGLRLLQEHLGHVSFNTTARYRKVASLEHKEWYKKLWIDLIYPE